MSLDITSNLDDIYNTIVNDSKDKTGILCLNCLLKYTTLENLKEIIKDLGIHFAEKSGMTKLDYLKYICGALYNDFQSNSQTQALYSDRLTYIGEMILRNERFSYIFKMQDFLPFLVQTGCSIGLQSLYP